MADRLGGGAAELADAADRWAQASRSLAVKQSCIQTSLLTMSSKGRLARPVSFGVADHVLGAGR